MENNKDKVKKGGKKKFLALLLMLLPKTTGGAMAATGVFAGAVAAVVIAINVLPGLIGGNKIDTGSESQDRPSTSIVEGANLDEDNTRDEDEDSTLVVPNTSEESSSTAITKPNRPTSNTRPASSNNNGSGAGNTSNSNSQQKPSDSEKPAEKPAEKPEEKPEEKPSDPAEKPEEKPTDPEPTPETNISATISQVSNNIKSTSQTAKITCAGDDVTKYYFGVKAEPAESDFEILPEVDKFEDTVTIRSAGEHHLVCVNKAEKVATTSKTFRSFSVISVLETIEGETNVYNNENYAIALTSPSYIVQDGTVVNFSDVLNSAPEHSSAGNYKGGASAFSGEQVGLVESATVSDNATYYTFYNRNRVELKLNTSEGINSVTGSGVYKSGAEVDIAATPVSGYGFETWAVRSGNTPKDLHAAETSIVLTENTELVAATNDTTAPTAPVITATGYNTFKFTSTDAIGVTGYYISTSNSKPSATQEGWTRNETYTADSVNTYYVWAKDASGNISESGSITAFSITTVGTNATASLSYKDADGANIANNSIVLDGINVYISVRAENDCEITSLTLNGENFVAPQITTISGNTVIIATASDHKAPQIKSVQRKNFDTFEFVAEDELGVAEWCVTNTDSAATCDWKPANGGTRFTNPYQIDSAGTWYVFARDGAGNTSTSLNITSYKITRSETNASLVTRYDATSGSTGTEFSDVAYVLSGTSIYVEATPNYGYANLTLSINDENVTSGSIYEVESTTNIAVSASTSAPKNMMIERVDYETFRYTAEDDVEVTGYFVSTTNTKPDANAEGWTTNTTAKISKTAARTYYVWAKDAVGNVSDPAQISSYQLTQSATDTVLTLKYSSAEGDVITGTAYVLSGSLIYVYSTPNFGFNNQKITLNNSVITSGTVHTIVADTVITSVAADPNIPSAPVIEVTSYKTFDFTSEDSAGINAYCVTTEDTSENCDWNPVTETTEYTGTHMIDSDGTYAVYIKNTLNKVSTASSISAYKVTRNSNHVQLITAFDATTSGEGTEFSDENNFALTGTKVYISAEADANYALKTLTYGTANLLDSAAGTYRIVNDNVTISADAADVDKPTAPVITRESYNSFSYASSDLVGVTGYYISALPTEPTVSSNWTTDTIYTAPGTLARTYYVWARDEAGNISDSKTISAYDITISATNATVEAHYDASQTAEGTIFTTSTRMLEGTPVRVKISALRGYTLTAAKFGEDDIIDNSSDIFVEANEDATILATAIDNTKPTSPIVTRTSHDGFSFTASDEVGITDWCVTNTDDATTCSWQEVTPVETYIGTYETGEYAADWFVFVRDAAKNISVTLDEDDKKSHIATYELTRTVSNATLNTQYINSDGSFFSKTVFVTAGTVVYVSATPNSGFTNLSIKVNDEPITSGSAIVVSKRTSIVVEASDSSGPVVAPVERVSYNTFRFTATDEAGVTAYCVIEKQNNEAPEPEDECSWNSVTKSTSYSDTYTISRKGKYYVYAQDEAENISNSESILAYEITFDSFHATLVAKYENSLGDVIEDGGFALDGTPIYVSATPFAGHTLGTITFAGNVVKSGTVNNITKDTEIKATAKDSDAPTTPVIERTNHNTFAFTSTDQDRVAAYCVTDGEDSDSCSSWVDVSEDEQTTYNGTHTIEAKAATWKVYTKDLAGNVSQAGTIKSFEVTRSATNAELTTRYDAKTATEGTEFSSTIYVLKGTEIYVEAKADEGYSISSLTFAGNSMTGNYKAVTQNTEIKVIAADSSKPHDLEVHYQSYNSFAYSAVDDEGSVLYYVTTSEGAPDTTDDTIWTSATTKTISGPAATYYVWVKDGANNLSGPVSINSYNVTRTVTEMTLTTKYDATLTGDGTVFMTDMVMVAGTPIYIYATANSGFKQDTLTFAGADAESGKVYTLAKDTEIKAIAKDSVAPTISEVEQKTYNTFTFTSTDTEGVAKYCVQKNVDSYTGCEWKDADGNQTYTGTHTIDSSASTWYVFTKDAEENISSSANIKSYAVTRSATKTTLTTKADSTDGNGGTNMTADTFYVVSGTKIYVKAEAESGYNIETLTFGGVNIKDKNGQAHTVSAPATAIVATSTDQTPPNTPTISRTNYRTFEVSATDKDNTSTIAGYYISTTSTEPTKDATGWTTTTSKIVDTTKENTYYVWAKDSAGNISDTAATIDVYQVSLSASNASLKPRYDYTNASLQGTAFSSTTYMLAGTPVYVTAEASTGYTLDKFYKKNTTTSVSVEIADKSINTIEYNTEFSVTSTDSKAPSQPVLTRKTYKTFELVSTDEVGVTGYCVTKTDNMDTCSSWSAVTKETQNNVTSYKATHEILSEAATWYVFTKDAAGNVSTSSNISSYKVTRSTTDATLTTKADSTDGNGGTNMTTTFYALNNTPVYVTASASKDGYSISELTFAGAKHTDKTSANVTKETEIKAVAKDTTAPATPTITRTDYNTFSYSSTDTAEGTLSYFVGTSSTAPTKDTAGWTTVTSKDISATQAETYYVWAKDAANNVSSEYAQITSYKVDITATNTTVTAKVDNATNLTNTFYALDKTPLTLTAKADTNYTLDSFKINDVEKKTAASSGVSYSINKNYTVVAESKDADDPYDVTVTRKSGTPTTMSIAAKDKVGITKWCVTNTNDASSCSWNTVTSTKTFSKDYTASITSETTWYAFVSDAADNAVSAHIESYQVTRSVENATMLTKYEGLTGTAFSKDVYVLKGTPIFVTGFPTGDYDDIKITVNETELEDNLAVHTVEGTTNIKVEGVDTTAPSVSVSRFSYDQFTISAGDKIGVTDYCVLRNNSNSNSCSWAHVDDEGITAYSTQYQITSDASSTWYVWAKDKAGNVSDFATIKSHVTTNNGIDGDSREGIASYTVTIGYGESKTYTLPANGSKGVIEGTPVYVYAARQDKTYNNPQIAIDKGSSTKVDSGTTLGVTKAYYFKAFVTKDTVAPTITLTGSVDRATISIEDANAVHQYCVLTSNSNNTTPDSSSGCTWVTTSNDPASASASKTVSTTKQTKVTVWAKDLAGNTSSAVIKTEAVVFDNQSQQKIGVTYGKTSTTVTPGNNLTIYLFGGTTGSLAITDTTNITVTVNSVRIAVSSKTPFTTASGSTLIVISGK